MRSFKTYATSQVPFTSSKSEMETPEQKVKSVQINDKDTIKTRCSDVLMFKLEQTSHIFLMFPLSSLTN